MAFTSLTQQESVASAYHTRLYAEESEESEAPVEETVAETSEEAPVAAAAADDDILNSPAFLNRKIDVLKSDIAAVEEKIAAANTVYEENKIEWGPQIENLRKEVSYLQLDCTYWHCRMRSHEASKQDIRMTCVLFDWYSSSCVYFDDILYAT
jgi:flagellar motility protein MotE (MotC chaperone)